MNPGARSSNADPEGLPAPNKRVKVTVAESPSLTGSEETIARVAESACGSVKRAESEKDDTVILPGSIQPVKVRRSRRLGPS